MLADQQSEKERSGQFARGRWSRAAAEARLRQGLAEVPDNEKLLSALDVTLGALGRRDEAIAALRANEIVPLATNPWFAQAHLEDLAWTYTLVGDHASKSWHRSTAE
jgi:hypothetical protein